MTATRMILLGAALTPYVALVGVDAWMHERARRVPRLEQALHYTAMLCFAGFIAAAFTEANGLALALLVVFVVASGWDEIAYHRHLDAREKRVHLASFAALALFLVLWVRTLAPA